MSCMFLSLLRVVTVHLPEPQIVSTFLIRAVTESEPICYHKSAYEFYISNIHINVHCYILSTSRGGTSPLLSLSIVQMPRYSHELYRSFPLSRRPYSISVSHRAAPRLHASSGHIVRVPVWQQSIHTAQREGDKDNYRLNALALRSRLRARSSIIGILSILLLPSCFFARSTAKASCHTSGIAPFGKII